MGKHTACLQDVVGQINVEEVSSLTAACLSFFSTLELTQQTRRRQLEKLLFSVFFLLFFLNFFYDSCFCNATRRKQVATQRDISADVDSFQYVLLLII